MPSGADVRAIGAGCGPLPGCKSPQGLTASGQGGRRVFLEAGMVPPDADAGTSGKAVPGVREAPE